MSENKHTPEPWHLCEVENETGRIKHLVPIDAEKMSLLTIVENDQATFAAIYNDDDARRIVACVNRLRNFTTEQIEDLGYDLFAEDRPRLFEAQNEILRLEKQRDELLSDLTEAKRSAEFNFEQYQDVGRLLHEECEKTEKLLAALERLLASHGYTSYLSEAEEDEDPDVIAARSAIASVKGGG